MTPAYDFIDHARLLADLRAEDQAAVAYAYRLVFGSELGRLVLVHQLTQAGVGLSRPADLSPIARAHADGEACHALRFAAFAGFDNFSVALALTTGQLQGRQDHDRYDDSRPGSGDPEPFSGPDDLPLID